MDFEKNLKKAELLSEKMSGGDLSLKDSLESYKEGMNLLTQCRKELDQAEQTVQKLIKINEETGEAETQDFKALKDNS